MVQKHKIYTEVIEDDAAFETEEKWLEDCQKQFLSLEARAKGYLEEMIKANSPKLQVNGENNTDVTQSEKTEENSNEKELVILEASQEDSSQVETPQASQNTIAQDDISENCAFRIEKPRMPNFTGDVREYAIFKSDFEHIIGSKYSNRDAIALLRTALTGKPLEMIKGIGSDYNAAWDYLDSVYGDPRFFSDTVTQDITRFKPLRSDEDSCFCELVHLVRRSYNTLKQVDRPHDMDNNHVLALIEQKMCNDDRKVWARYLEKEKTEPKLATLIE